MAEPPTVDAVALHLVVDDLAHLLRTDRDPPLVRRGVPPAGLALAQFVPDAQRLQISEQSEPRSEEHTSELQSRENLVCRLLLEKKKHRTTYIQRDYIV